MIGDFAIFYLATKAMLSGASPYTIPGFFCPVWALLPFIPLTIFPLDVAKVLYSLMTCAGFIAALCRFHIRPRYIILVSLLSSLLWINIFYSNVDWLVLLGATLPAPLGIWLVLIKPQLAIGVIAFWLLRGTSRRWMAPAFVAFALNYALLGLPNLRSLGVQANFFPWGLPIAVLLMVQALRQSSMVYAVPVALFTSPYISITSWLMAAPLARSWRWLIVVVVASWLIYLRWLRII